MKTKIFVSILTMVLLFGFVSQSMGLTTKEKMTPTTGSLLTESKPVPPVSSSEEIKILGQLKQQAEELKKEARAISDQAKTAGKERTAALKNIAEATRSKAEADKELANAMKSFGNKIDNVSASVIQVIKKNIGDQNAKNTTLILALVALGFAVVFLRLYMQSKTLERIEQRVDSIPGKTANITDMWEINLGNGITYRPPLSNNGRRLSLQVPEGIVGEYPEPAQIPRIPIENLTEMEDSVTKTLVKYYNNEYELEGLQARVIRHAIDSGQLRGL
ncbi:MAG: hypothetical protein WCX17_03675 [Parcubacteria group bacterium]|jgi:hypothetical protein